MARYAGFGVGFSGIAPLVKPPFEGEPDFAAILRVDQESVSLPTTPVPAPKALTMLGRISPVYIFRRR